MGGEFYFPQQFIKIDFTKVNGVCQIVWKASQYFHCTLPSKDTTSDTRIGMSCQVSKKLANAFKKFESGKFPINYKVCDAQHM